MKRLDRILLVAAYVLLGAVVVFLSYDVDKRLTEAQTSLEQTQTVLENEAAVACILGQTNLITANGIVNDFIDTLPEENQQVVKLQWTESVLTSSRLCVRIGHAQRWMKLATALSIPRPTRSSWTTRTASSTPSMR